VFTPPPPIDPNGFKVRTDVEVVLLDVAVKDSHGGFVSGLQKEDFLIEEQKVPQPIKIFAAQDTPVTVGLIIDNSGSVRPKKPEIVTAALTFVTQSNPADEVFIVNFNDRVRKGLPDGVDFSGDRNLLRMALLTNPAQGRTALYDAIQVGLQHLDKGRLDKKTLVVIADGGDNASDLNRDELTKLAEESLATIYTVGIYNPDDKDKNPRFLKHISSLSGGEHFEPENINNLVGICEKIAKDIRNRYTLGFTPTNLRHDGKLRKIKVSATHPDTGKKLEVRTRTHYVASSRDDISQAASGTSSR
jgi:VWFA-related protein